MSTLISHLRNALAPAFAPYPRDSRRAAAVALLLAQGEQGEYVLLVERAPHGQDPWSGNIALPGGKVEAHDSDPRTTAERETREEVGIDLRQAEYLGFLTEIVGAHLPVRVACFVYLLPQPTLPLTLSDELADAFWVPLATLMAPERQITAQVSFAGNQHQVPAIKLPHPGKPVLWGITYRLLQHFFTLHPEESCVT